MDSDPPTLMEDHGVPSAGPDANGMLAPVVRCAAARDDGGRQAGPDQIGAGIRLATVASRAIFTPETWRGQVGGITVDGWATGIVPDGTIHFTSGSLLQGGANAGLGIA